MYIQFERFFCGRTWVNLRQFHIDFCHSFLFCLRCFFVFSFSWRSEVMKKLRMRTNNGKYFFSAIEQLNCDFCYIFIKKWNNEFKFWWTTILPYKSSILYFSHKFHAFPYLKLFFFKSISYRTVYQPIRHLLCAMCTFYLWFLGTC